MLLVPLRKSLPSLPNRSCLPRNCGHFLGLIGLRSKPARLWTTETPATARLGE